MSALAGTADAASASQKGTAVAQDNVFFQTQVRFGAVYRETEYIVVVAF